jgi:hypothetical protein
MGKIAGEAEMLDFQTGEILVQAIDSEVGKKYKVGKSASKWGQSKLIMDAWAKTFRERLDKLRMGKAAQK